MGLVDFEVRDGVGWLDMDDGKANVVSPAMQDAIGAALDEAEEADVAVVVRGRPNTFSGGFDLSILVNADQDAVDMVLGGFRVTRRLLAHPRPVVTVAAGHAIAQGAFLLLAGDLRLIADGDLRVVANEVALGTALPHVPTELLRHRLTERAYVAATTRSFVFDPEAALVAGWVDEVVPAEQLDARTAELAAGLVELDRDAYATTKERVLRPLLAAVDAALEDDATAYAAQLVAHGRIR